MNGAASAFRPARSRRNSARFAGFSTDRTSASNSTKFCRTSACSCSIVSAIRMASSGVSLGPAARSTASARPARIVAAAASSRSANAGACPAIDIAAP